MTDSKESPGQAAERSETDSSSEQDTSSSSGTAWLASNRVQALANVLTVVVALAAIGLSVWEGLENRRHNRLSVLPHLKPIEADLRSATPIEHEYFLLPSGMDSLSAVSYALENSGLGPAVLKNVLVFRDSEKVYDAVQSDSTYGFNAIKRDLDRLPFETILLRNTHTAGEMLKAGEVHYFATVAFLSAL